MKQKTNTLFTRISILKEQLNVGLITKEQYVKELSKVLNDIRELKPYHLPDKESGKFTNLIRIFIE